MTPKFQRDPLEYIEGDERTRAVRALKSYYTKYTGRHFDLRIVQATGNMDRRIDESPNQFTEADLLSVTMLGVAIPPKAAAAILYESASAKIINDLLHEIEPPDLAIWDMSTRDLRSGSPALNLWDKLGMRKGSSAMKGMGRTIRSKLLAAKRPCLFPIFDQFLGKALLEKDSDDWWILWRNRLEGSEGDRLRKKVDEVRAAADGELRQLGVTGVGELPVLRILDVVIWMREHGWKDDAEHLGSLGFSAPMKPC